MAKHLREQELKGFLQSIESENKEKLWSALECLVDHLNDHLAVVDETRLKGGDPCRLMVFTARDDQRTLLYATILRNGSVIVGRLDRLDSYRILQLDDFDPVWDVIVSLVVTGELRPLGERLDLWIVVQRYPKPAAEATNIEQNPVIVAYHGLVWMDGRLPILQPSLDDGIGKHDDGLWRHQAADRLSSWLQKYNVTFAPGADPFAVLSTVDRYSDQLLPSVDVIACNKDNLCFGRNDWVHLIHHPEPAKKLPLPEPIWSLALLGTIQGVVHGVAGCDDRRLVAFRETETETGLEEVWRQVQDDFPAALAALPATVETDSSEDWPDLLVAFSDGGLQRLRYRGRERIRKVWEDCWEKLGLTDAQSQIDAARENLDHSRARRKATLIGAIESVLDATDVSPEQYQERLNAINSLFRPTTTREVLSAGLDCLLAALSRFARGTEPARPLLGC